MTTDTHDLACPKRDLVHHRPVARGGWQFEDPVFGNPYAHSRGLAAPVEVRRARRNDQYGHPVHYVRCPTHGLLLVYHRRLRLR